MKISTVQVEVGVAGVFVASESGGCVQAPGWMSAVLAGRLGQALDWWFEARQGKTGLASNKARVLV